MPINVEGLTIEPILQSISCTLEDQRLTLIVGRSGSGKSTLLRALAGLVKAGAGSISYDRVPLWTKGKTARRVLLQNAIAFQFPEHQLFARTIQGEFDYSQRPYRLNPVERAGRVRDAMQSLRLPPSMLAQSPFALSGGQKRGAALATLLATDAAWLLLDEPSAGLDAAAAARLRGQLVEWKSSRSIVMATHDWEFFLPVADRVLVLAEGRLLADVTPQELRAAPGLLLQAGIGAPDAIKLAHELLQAGIDVPVRLLSPEQMAAEIIDRREAGNPSSSVPMNEIAGASAVFERASDEVEESNSQKRRIYHVEARLKWLVYMALSVVILLQRHWLGMSVALIAAFAALNLLRKEHALQALRLSQPLLFFIAVTATFSAVQVFPQPGWILGFNGYAWLSTAQRLLPFFAVTVIGFVFSLSTSTAEMKQGLEKALSMFERFRIPTSMLALAASLVLRFIPMILKETERFSLIAAARGKRIARRGRIHLRDIHVFTIPLLISLFQMVEDLVMAMEIKGFLKGR